MKYLVESYSSSTNLLGGDCNCWVQISGQCEEQCTGQICVQNACPNHCWTQACNPRTDPSRIS